MTCVGLQTLMKKWQKLLEKVCWILISFCSIVYYMYYTQLKLYFFVREEQEEKEQSLKKEESVVDKKSKEPTKTESKSEVSKS